MSTERWREEFTSEQQAWLDVVWGKSDVEGEVHLLIQHLLDALAVGELIWDRFLARSTRDRFDFIAGPAGGRALFAWICGVHDVGKATPVFQKCSGSLGDRVNAAGLPVDPRIALGGWRHDKAGGSHLFTELPALFKVGRRDEATCWLWPLVAGHHGRIPTAAEVNLRGTNTRGTMAKHGVDPKWVKLRTAVMTAIAVASGAQSLDDLRPSGAPSRGDQLSISGLMIMADWIASSPQFPAVTEWNAVSLEGARSRAAKAWKNLGLGGGWRDLAVPPNDIVQARFGNLPRAVQALAIDLARAMEAPGLMVVEAPMGEGKTELALAAAEVLAHRFGSSGVAVGMPTQATCDAMFARVQPWLEALGGSSQLALLHGKRLVNNDWNQLVRRLQTRSGRSELTDEFDLADSYGVTNSVCEDCEACESEEVGVHAASEWFLGRYRGMLTPHFVGTIDQLLFAATRTKFVSLRFSGLAGKVVIIDEVHAVDSYMTEFLGELLTWLGSARIPVILLSATLAPVQRKQLVRSYLGLSPEDQLDSQSTVALSERCGYPQITLAANDGISTRAGQHKMVRAYSSESSRAPQRVEVGFIEGFDEDADARLVEAIDQDLSDGGIALIIRNTVKRAQSLFGLLSDRYGEDVRLLHSRFTAGHRAEDTAEIVRLIGPPLAGSSLRPGSSDRPDRLIVVATQVAEQSFDVDADVLFTDLAPIDLVLQRVGRLHRHERDRPKRLSTPKVYVTAMPPTAPGQIDDQCVLTEPGGTAVYKAHHLLRAATLLSNCESEGLVIPADIPRLVDAAYGNAAPAAPEWVETAMASEEKWTHEDRKRRDTASEYRLAPSESIERRTLEGLHTRASAGSDVESRVRVRDSENDSMEVVLLRRTEGRFWTIDGEDLGPNGDWARDHPSLVVSGLVRIPNQASKGSTSRSESGLHRELERSAVRISGWSEHPWLGRLPVVVVDGNGVVRVPGFELSYDRRLGLSIVRSG